MIETKELIKHLRQLGKYSEFKPNYFLLAADRIEELSGRVEVCKCKDCEFVQPTQIKINGKELKTCELYKRPCFDNDFCSKGLRKESEVDTE